jgi:hypothetical protein
MTEEEARLTYYLNIYDLHVIAMFMARYLRQEIPPNWQMDEDEIKWHVARMCRKLRGRGVSSPGVGHRRRRYPRGRTMDRNGRFWSGRRGRLRASGLFPVLVSSLCGPKIELMLSVKLEFVDPAEEYPHGPSKSGRRTFLGPK